MTENTETKSFVMYDSFFEAAEQMQMDYEAIGKYVMMLRAYAIKGQELKCDDGRVNALLTLTKPLITASTNRYKKAVKGGEHGWKGGEHGIKGGRPRLGETKEDAYERRRKERELKEQELNQEPLPAAEPKTAVEVPVNPINPLNDYVNDYEKLKENGYAKDNVDEKDDEGVLEKDFMSSLILDDYLDEEEEYHFYEEGSASAYMERLRHPALTGLLSMTLIVKEKRERPIPKGGIETQSIAQRPSSSTSPRCESKVEFRPGPAPVRCPRKLLWSGFTVAFLAEYY